MAKQSLNNPSELFRFQLRSALTMEDSSLESLKELKGVVKSKEIRELIKHHIDETKEQIDNLNKVFKLCDFKRSTAPSPASTGIQKQARSLIERTDPKLHDQVALVSAMGNEHFEISQYQGLIVLATSLKATDSVPLLQANLDQEKHTSKELHSTLKTMFA